MKGTFFVIGRRLMDRHYPGGADAFANVLPVEARPSFADPLASAWYPEEHFAALLQTMNRELCEGDPKRLETLLESGSEQGISRFFSAVLGLARPGFVIRRIPVLWQLIRNGGRARVTPVSGGSQIRYEDFPFFHLAEYRAFTLASVRALLRLTGSEQPDVTQVGAGTDWMVVRAAHD